MKGLIFTYLLCYGGSVASLFRPWYGFLIYVCFAIVRPESLWHWSLGGGSGNFSRIIAISLLVGWAIHGFGNWKLGKAKLTVSALVACWIWALLSTLIVASNKEVGFRYLENHAKILLPFLAGITLIRTEAQVKQLAWTILLSQGYVAWHLNESYFNGFNMLNNPWSGGGFGGMDNNCVAIAMVTAAGLAFCLGLHEKIWWRKWLAFACAGLMAHSIMFAFSRGGMLGLMITGAITFLLLDKKPSHYVFFAFAVIVGFMLAGPEVRERFASAFVNEEERDASAQSRVDMWKICLRIMAENPAFGIGPDHFTVHASSFGLTQGKEAHTLWLQYGAELGAVGLAFLLTFYLATIIKLWPVHRRKRPNATEWDVAVARMIIASFTGFMVSAQFVSLEGLELPYYITLIGAGTLKLSSRRGETPVYSPASDYPRQMQPVPAHVLTNSPF